MYWDNVWNKNDIEEYRNYLGKYIGLNNSMVKTLNENHCHKVCDAACGFGANSLVLLSNHFDVFGFDVAKNSVWLTCHLLKDYGIKDDQFKVASLLDTGYENSCFDAVTARAVLDHLSVQDLEQSLLEFQRIIKKQGLLFATFDPLEEDDIATTHQILEDGSFLYTSEERNGLLFHYYSDEEIKQIFSKFDMLYFEKDERGNRNVMVRIS